MGAGLNLDYRPPPGWPINISTTWGSTTSLNERELTRFCGNTFKLYSTLRSAMSIHTVNDASCTGT